MAGLTRPISWATGLGQGQDEDDVVWESAVDTETIEPGTCPPSDPCCQPTLSSGLVPASIFSNSTDMSPSMASI